MLLGLAWTIAGLVLLGGVYFKVIPSMPALGTFVVAAGLLAVLGSLIGRTSAGFFSELVPGALIGVLGFVLLRYPDAPLSALLLLAGALFAANGLVRLGSASEFPALRGVLFIGGAASLALSAAVFTDAVKPSFLALGVLIGVELIVDGLTILLVGRHEHAGRR